MNSSVRSYANDSDLHMSVQPDDSSERSNRAEQEVILQNYFRNIVNNRVNVPLPQVNIPIRNQPADRRIESEINRGNTKTPQDALINVVRNNLVIQFVFLTSILHFAWHTPFWIIFGVIWLYDITVIKNAINDVFATTSKEVKKLSIISITEYVCIGLTKVKTAVFINKFRI